MTTAPPEKPTEKPTETQQRLLPGAELRDEQHASLQVLTRHDTLVVLAPGAGKTAIYAIGGELLGGTTLVVSPTLSLQRDQVRMLRDAGLKAAALNSTHSAGHRRRQLRRLREGELAFLLLAPEQLARTEVLDELRAARPALLVVDEAHCISEWGHDFRPDYLALGAAVEALGHPRIVALTATAAPAVREEILDRLGARDARTVLGDTDHPQLWLSVHLHAERDAKLDAVRRTVAEHQGSGLVYVATRRHAEELAEALRTDGVAVAAYHGRMRRAERERTQDAFTRGELRVVVGTSAFGMGIDKPDVRFVLHADTPPSVDAYYQEVGRAGRDGRAAIAALHYRPADLAIPAFLTGGADPDTGQLTALLRAAGDHGPMRRAELAERAGLPRRTAGRLVPLLVAAGALREVTGSRLEAGDVPEHQAVDAAVQHARRRHELERSRVEMVRRYAETTGCRRRTLLELLGETRDEPCGRCDNCAAGHGGDRDPGGWRPGQPVSHPDFGEGTVQTVEGETAVVLFDDGGYRSLSLPVVEEQELLTPRPVG